MSIYTMQYHNFRNAHHSPNYENFDAHVLFFGNNAYCLGCFVSNLFITLLPLLLALLLTLPEVIANVTTQWIVISISALLLAGTFSGPYISWVEEISQVFRLLSIIGTCVIIWFYPLAVIPSTLILVLSSMGLALPQFLLHTFKILRKVDQQNKVLKATTRFLFCLSLLSSSLILSVNPGIAAITFTTLLSIFLFLWLVGKRGLEIPESKSIYSTSQSWDFDDGKLKSFSCVGPLNACTKGGGGGGCCGCNLTPCFALIGVAVILVIVFLFVSLGVGPGRP